MSVETYTAEVAPEWTPEPPLEDAGESKLPSPLGVESSLGDEELSAHLIDPDPELMAEMTCEPVAQDTLDTMSRHTADDPRDPTTINAQVFFGEGNEPGSQWWMVASEASGPMTFLFLTDYPGVEHGPGVWINLDVGERQTATGEWRPTFHNVDWDYEKLVRGQSAVAKVRKCVAEEKQKG